MRENRSLKYSILLIEKESDLAGMIQDSMQGHEFLVNIEAHGKRALNRALTENSDLIILDMDFPGLDGLTICKKIRSDYRHPILIIADKSGESEELAYLDAGADDYMIKPVKPQILLARIRMLIRRSQGYDGDNRQMDLGSIIIDLGRRIVQIDNQTVQLSTIEFNLLHCLARNVGDVLTRDQLCLALRGREWSGIDRSIDLCISRLRKKIGDNGKMPQRIKSVRNIGYVLIPD